MTLLLGLANSENVILVADRRFTFKRRPPDNEQNKIAVLWFDDARILAGFSGTATVDNFETHRRFLETIKICAPKYSGGRR
jgi:hypothetical protein